ncbi:glycosyltransferase [Tepidibacillus marianensis]|uniref:glycosyltransferase family 2 protein n=1 Tax=Tepidibacillus marianensis TaxID=3131995 RepID=UPI0030D09D32
MTPKISIIVPVYNVQDYLHKCIDSILSQTFEDFELLLINDGSTDESANICNEYAKLDSRIKVKHKHNGGQSSARNLGLDMANGDYIGFVDSDDWIDKKMYKNLINHAACNQSDIVACNFLLMKNDAKFIPYTLNAIDMEFNKESAMKEIYTNKILTFSPCNKIYRKELFEKLRFVEGIILEDKDISYKLISKSNRISYLKEPLYYYRYNENSTLRSSFSLKRLDDFKVQKDMYNFYLKHYPEISDLVYFDMFNVGSNLYMLTSIYYKDKIKDYKYLIDFDSKILKRLVKNKDLTLSRKFKVLLSIISPGINIFLRKIVYKIRRIN